MKILILYLLTLISNYQVVSSTKTKLTKKSRDSTGTTQNTDDYILLADIEKLINEEEPKTEATAFTTVTESIKTTITEPVSSTCVHEWKRFDPFDDPFAPANDGLYLGHYIDGSPIYVGRGSSTSFKRYILPARAYVNGSAQSGIYVVSYPSEFCDTSKTAQYLVANPEYQYKWIMSSQGEMEANAIGWSIAGYKTSIARINLTKSNGQEFSQIGASVTKLGTIYFNPISMGVSNTGLMTYEALICVPKNVKYESELCVHKWKRYRPQKAPDSPAIDGFLIGNYYDNSLVYLGRGNDICNTITPARVNIIKNSLQKPGIYTSCDSIEFLDDSETAEYFVANLNYTYTWVNASSDDNFVNSVRWTSPGNTDVLAVSRIKIFDRKTKKHFWTVGKTFIGTGTWFYNPLTDFTETVGKSKVEILICSPKGSRRAMRKASDNNNKCVHNWIELRPSAELKTELKDGVLAGYYIDGSPIYVGIGYHPTINDIVPARVSISGSLEPGAYVCGLIDTELIDRKDSAAYLEYNISQTYNWVKTKPKYQVANQVEVNGLYFTHTIARINMTDEKRQFFTQIGTNYVGVASYYYNPVKSKVENITQYIDDVEILTCAVIN